MRRIILAFLRGSLLELGNAPGPVNASPAAESPHQSEVTRNEVVFNFPETATFQFSIDHPMDITSIVLEYGNRQQTCGEVVAKAFPEFRPGKRVEAEWTWDMRQFGSLPPGSQLWWRWRITDANGEETVTDTKTATWLDDTHNWKTVQNGDYLRLQYYEGDHFYINTLSQAAADGHKFNETHQGLKADDPVDLYIFANTADMKDSILYEPSWTGGQAFPAQNIVIIMDYLGRYTHRVALSNDRLVKLEDNQVTFRWRDSADNNKIKWLPLEVFEFIRRFLLHVLPEQFVKIRYYGILSHRSRKGKLLRCKKLLRVVTSEVPEAVSKETWQDLLTRITGIDPRVCPHCGKGKMIQKEILLPQENGRPP